MAKTTKVLVAVTTLAAALVAMPGTAGAAVEVSPSMQPQHQRMADFDGDGKADLAVWRPSTGQWFIQLPGPIRKIPRWGQEGDIPVPADYDGDGTADLAVFRPSTAYWYIKPSGGGDPIARKHGYANNTPVAADFDGDGKADLAVYTSSRTWEILRSSDGTETVFGSGQPGDIALAGDYDGDGKADPGEWRPSNSSWHYTRSSDGQTVTQQFGDPNVNVSPAIGDFDGDGRDDLALMAFYNSTYFVYFYWHVLHSSTGSDEYFHLQDSGYWVGHLPVTGDFDGDGRTDTGMVIDENAYNPDGTLGVWRIRDANGQTTDYIVGKTGDYPV